MVSGAKIVTCFGLLRRNFSAYFSITVRPPEVCRKPAQVTTAKIVSITSIGGEPGLYWNTNVNDETNATDNCQTDTAMADTENQAGQQHYET